MAMATVAKLVTLDLLPLATGYLQFQNKATGDSRLRPCVRSKRCHLASYGK